MEENQKRSGTEPRAEGEGRTLAEAETEAFARLEEIAGPCEWDQVEFEVISEGSKGFLGMGSEMARVEARLTGSDRGESGGDGPADAGAAPEYAPNEARTPDDEYEGAEAGYAEPPEAGAAGEPATEAEARLRELLDHVADALGVEASVHISDDGEELVADLVGGDLGLFIGRHGSTLDAVQYLANIIVFRGLEGRKRVIIDAEDYRGRREDVLRSLADRAASEVMKGKMEYELKPMSAAERRIIHIHLQKREGIVTTSEGREPFRRVIITRIED